MASVYGYKRLMTMTDDAPWYLAVQRFLALEAQFLDDDNWRAWLALYAPEAIYWMPLNSTQVDHLSHASLLCDDGVLRELRCRRWYERETDTGAISLQPSPRTIRHLTNLTVAAPATADIVTARANLLMAEYTHGEVREHHARASWRLIRNADSFLIAEKRIDLLNARGPLSDILAYL
jgi:3-phenylpropionate/cinnamic acid dioxygenase small subunit